MKVLFVSQVPDSRLMGVPRILYCIGDELQKRGHTVHYFFEDGAPKPLLKSVSLMEWAVRSAPLVAERCRKEQYDVIAVTTFNGWFLSTFRKCFLPNHTRIVSMHQGWEELMWRQMQAEEASGGYRFSKKFKAYYSGPIVWSGRQTLKTQDLAFFSSTEERDWIKSRYPQWAHKAVYLPNGVSEKYFYPERYKISQPDAPVKLLFVGYWDPWRKGRKYLEEAYAELLKKHPGIRLSLMGTKLEAKDILPGFAPETHGSIRIVPQADEATLIEAYRTHDIFVLPSLFEGMPLVMLEAMASGLPVVTTGNNGMKDIIASGENGLLVPRRDVPALTEALSRLIADAPLRRQLGLNAYETIRNAYTWSHITDMFEGNLLRIRERQPSGSTP